MHRMPWGCIYMLVSVIVAFIAAGGVILLLWLLRGFLLMPVRLGEGRSLDAALTLKGDCPELERTVEALLWLSECGALPLRRIIIVDAGLSTRARSTAEVKAKNTDRIVIIDRDEFTNVLTR